MLPRSISIGLSPYYPLGGPESGWRLLLMLVRQVGMVPALVAGANITPLTITVAEEHRFPLLSVEQPTQVYSASCI